MREMSAVEAATIVVSAGDKLLGEIRFVALGTSVHRERRDARNTTEATPSLYQTNPLNSRRKGDQPLVCPPFARTAAFTQ
jgi:hypothetical protein